MDCADRFSLFVNKERDYANQWIDQWGAGGRLAAGGLRASSHARPNQLAAGHGRAHDRAGNGLPDVAVSYQNDIANYQLSGAKIQPLDAWITDTQMGFSATDLADIYPSFIDHYPGSNNQVLSIAYNRSMEVMYYNADMLQA